MPKCNQIMLVNFTFLQKQKKTNWRFAVSVLDNGGLMRGCHTRNNFIFSSFIDHKKMKTFLLFSTQRGASGKDKGMQQRASGLSSVFVCQDAWINYLIVQLNLSLFLSVSFNVSFYLKTLPSEYCYIPTKVCFSFFSTLQWQQSIQS